MSFSMSFGCARAEVEEKLAGNSAPECVKEFVRQAAASLTCEKVAVTAYGHLHDGTESNYKPSNCSIDVKPIE